jgi:plastocyanin
MRRTGSVVVMLALVAIAASGCASAAPAGINTGGAVPRPSAPATISVASVAIKDGAFSPPLTPVPAGTAVTWTNQDSVAHTVSGEGWDSGTIEAGASFTRRFDAAGAFDYTCSIHPSAAAEILVR